MSCSWCDRDATGRALDLESGSNELSCGAMGHGINHRPTGS